MQTRPSLPQQYRPGWDSIAGRFPAPRECLAAYLALEVAEVLGRVKPANLINLPNRTRACGRNLYRLWRQCGADVIEGSSLEVRELVDRGDSLLLLFYDPQALATLLARKKITAILSRVGYRAPTDLTASLAELEARLRTGTFPHEIGLFLGYPPKDVAGFMGWTRLPFTCQGPWKIYGDPASSLELANTCRKCRLGMARHLADGGDPFDCLHVHHDNRAFMPSSVIIA